MITNQMKKRIRFKTSAAMTAAALIGITATASLPARADEFTVGRSGADVAFSQNGLTGSGVTVAVLDSGIRYCPDLNSPSGSTRIVASQSLIPGDTNTDDLCGHGTHVAGIIAGNGAASTGPSYFRTFYGIARNTNLISLRVLDAHGAGAVSTVISGIQWCVKNKAKYNIRVISMSLGHPVGESYTMDPLCQAAEAAWKAGIVVVCAAGNDGRLTATPSAGAANEGWGRDYGSIQSPGNDPFVITVGAMKNFDGTRSHDRIGTYSSRGPSRLDYVMKPDLVAPGNQVVSCYSYNSYLFQYNTANMNGLPAKAYINTTWNGFSTDYFVLSGTSMATPVVSGAVALMLQRYPTLTPDTIKARLMLTADKWGAPDGTMDPCTYGAGYLNIPAALASNAVPTQAALSPSLSEDAGGNVLVDANKVIWGTANGAKVIWGVSGVNNLRIIWGSKVIWGTSSNILDASKVIWGTNVWADKVIWGTSSTAVDLTNTALQGE